MPKEDTPANNVKVKPIRGAEANEMPERSVKAKETKLPNGITKRDY